MSEFWEIRFNATSGLAQKLEPLYPNGNLHDLATLVTAHITTSLKNHPRQWVGVTTISVISAILIRSILTSAFYLREFSGPWWAAYTRVWLSRTLASTKSAQTFVDINQRYGSTARIGPNHLVTDDPELTRTILAVGSKWRRGPWFDSIRIDPRVTNIVSERDIRKHNAMRRRMANGYAGKDIEGLEDVVDERVTEFISTIDKNWISSPGKSKVFDIARRVQFFTIDTITQVCFGKPMGFVKSDIDKHNFIATIETQLPIVQHFSVFLFLNTIILWVAKVPTLRRLVVPSSTDKSGIGVVMGVSIRPPLEVLTYFVFID